MYNYKKNVGKSFGYKENRILITDYIAKGGNSVVFECKYLNKQYVIKYFLGAQEKRYERFKLELDKINILNNNIKDCTPAIIEHNFPGEIVKKFSKLNIQTSPFYIMEKGMKFDYTILNFEEKIDSLIEFALKLQKMHTLNYVHRDIKPENMLYYHNQLSLIDYGTSRIPGIETVDENERMGSIGTMAPEMVNRINGQDEENNKYSDIYSLGKTIWIILTNDRDACKFTTYNPNSINSKIKIDGVHEGIIMELEQIVLEATKENYLERISLNEIIERLIIIKEKLINKPQNCNIIKFQCLLKEFLNIKYDSININEEGKVLSFINNLNLIGTKLSLNESGKNLCDSLEANYFTLLYDSKLQMYYFESSDVKFMFKIKNININNKSVNIETIILNEIPDENYVRLKEVDFFSRSSILTHRIDIGTSKVYLECDICLEPIELK